MDDVIASCEICHLKDDSSKKVFLIIYLPKLDKDQRSFRCHYKITFDEYFQRENVLSSSAGESSFQALQLAINKAYYELMSHNFHQMHGELEGYNYDQLGFAFPNTSLFKRTLLVKIKSIFRK